MHPAKKQAHLNKLRKQHKDLDKRIEKLYNTTNSERTLKLLKVEKLDLKDKITDMENTNGKEN
jgi:hypothetical protein|tara:strand:- start:1303 stop:1491 length:189 start_codon:yes stop_codon:yes gene_type:complete